MTPALKTAVIILGEAALAIHRQKSFLDYKLSKTESVLIL